MNSAELKQAARRFGADLVGIAPADRFEGVAPERHPASIFPECRAVVVLARRVLRGALRGVEEGTNFGSTYHTFGYVWVEDNFLAQTAYDTTCWIEERDFEAVPLFAYFEDGMPKGAAVAPGKPPPNVYLDPYYAAVAAGLGEIGLGDFLITPEFGTRQRLSIILTDAPLEPDPVRNKTICGDCGACAEACPFGAIDLAKRRPAGVPGSPMEVAAVDYALCRACPNGAMLGPGRGSRPDRIAAACGRACLVRLETGGRVGNRFEQPFRKRKPWALDAFRRPVEAASSDASSVGCDGVGSAAKSRGAP